MNIAIAVATSENNAIGKDNQLLWHLPADLKFFKNTTMGCPVVMGRKTFQSIGRTLPGRKNVVITRDSSFNQDKQFDIEVVNSLEQALDVLKDTETVFIIGGGEIYKQALPLTHIVYRTLVHTSIDGDTFFPELTNTDFKLVWEEKHLSDEKNKYDYTFQKFERI